MKKTLVFALAVVLVVAFVMPASAFESVFGGYWRTRWSQQANWTGTKDESAIKNYDTRTRLYYTAKFSDDFSFVNKFEWNVTWGDAVGGDIGTDGMGIFRIKNSYADFRTGQFRHTVGLQGAVIARGFLFDDDFAGYVARFQPGTTADMLIPFAWIRAVDGGSRGGTSQDDVNTWAAWPFFPIGDAMVLNPYFVYQQSNGGQGVGAENRPMWLGVDFDWKADAFGLWASGIANFGSASSTSDYSGYLLAAGVDFNLGAIGLWVDGIYATGEDSSADTAAFTPPAGASYYWAEILGYGIFDQAGPGVKSASNQITDLMTIGVGADWKLGDKFKLSTDIWYAMLAEDDAFGKNGLGTEIDVILTWALVENLNVDVVAAYLLADDALFGTGVADEDPYEVGARMSFSF